MAASVAKVPCLTGGAGRPAGRGRLAAALVLGMGIACGAAPVLSQSYVGAPCRVGSIPRFEDHLQSLWYRRFWTGDCKDLPALGCRSGRPNWNQVVQTLVGRAPAARRPQIAAESCRLGRRIGFEWTRPKAERRIDTEDLKSFNDALEKAPDVSAGLAAVEARVRAKIGS